MVKVINFVTIFLLSVFAFSQSSMQFSHGISKQKIKFEYHHHLIIIPVEINNTQLNFILDTGTSKNVIFTINESDSLILNNTQLIELKGLGGGEPIEAILSENNTIKIGKIIGLNQSIYMVLKDQFDLSSRTGKTIHGILGYEFFKNFIVDINYDTKILTVYNPDTFDINKKRKFEMIPLFFHQNKPYLECEISLNDTLKMTSKMLIDTGNSDAIWVFENAKKGIITPQPFLIDHIGEGLSGSILGKRAKINNLKFGKFNLEKPYVAFIDSTSFSAFNIFKERDGSIGNQILNRFAITIDYPNQKIYLKKNKKFNTQFIYNKSGIELAYMGQTLVKNLVAKDENDQNNKESMGGTKITFNYQYEFVFKPLYGIMRIREKSPAEKAGLLEGDLITKINEKNTSDYDIEELQDILYGVNQKALKLEINRKGMVSTKVINLINEL